MFKNTKELLSKVIRSKALLVYIGVIVIGFIANNFSVDTQDKWSQSLWNFYSAFDVSSAVALSILALLGYIEYIKSEDVIKILFDVEGELKDTKLSVLRKNFSRAELFGLLGMIQKDPKKRYHVNSLQEPAKLLKEIQEVQKSWRKKEFVIKMTKKEFEDFSI